MPFIEHIHDPALGHASYVVGDEQAGVAAVIDPARNPEPYERIAARHGASIVLVLDTHGHNDYLSGVDALRRRGAVTVAPIGATVSYPANIGWHGRRYTLGSIELELLHTPGHTPEHTSVLVHGLGPSGLTLLSGGSLLIGDVGRPDLFGGQNPLESARAMNHTVLNVLLSLPDDTEVRPTHVGGSLCAGDIRPGLVTTIGVERTTNPTVLAMLDEPDAPEAWLEVDALPPVPPFWPKNRALNLRGVPSLATTAGLEEFAAADVPRLQDDALIIDVRAVSDGQTRLQRSIDIPLQGTFPVWAGIAAGESADVYVVADEWQQASEAATAISRVHPSGVSGWIAARALDELPSLSLRTAASAATPLGAHETLIDVRNPAEALASPIPGARVIPAALLIAAPDTAPMGPLRLACASGFRAVIVASVLQHHGRTDVSAHVGSGFDLADTTAATLVGSET